MAHWKASSVLAWRR